jgi:prevent-host-death family protein
LKETDELGERFVITRSGRPAAVLMSVEEYEGLMETLEVLADERLMRQLRSGLRDAEAAAWYPMPRFGVAWTVLTPLAPPVPSASSTPPEAAGQPPAENSRRPRTGKAAAAELKGCSWRTGDFRIVYAWDRVEIIVVARVRCTSLQRLRG